MTSLKADLVEDFYNTCLSICFELKKHFKQNRIYISFILAILLPLAFYVVPKIWNIGFSETAAGFANTNLGFVNLLIIISGSLFAGDAVASEFEEKTGLLLFPTPQRHTSIFVGKYVGALIPTFSVVSLYYLITSLEMVQLYGLEAISYDLFKSFMIALIYSTSAVSLIFFFSSILERKITSTLLGFFSLMMILPIISTVLQVVEIEPWFILTYPADLITDVFNVTTTQGFGPGGGEFVTFSPDFYTGLIIMASYAIVLFLMGLCLSTRRSME